MFKHFAMWGLNGSSLETFLITFCSQELKEVSDNWVKDGLATRPSKIGEGISRRNCPYFYDSNYRGT
jgi:hypothetical protein